MNTETAAKLARELMNNHGLEHWDFGFDRAINRAGQCNYTRQRITISRPVTEASSEVEVMNTILHEIAHVLAGARAGHGPIWVSHFRALGGDGSRTIQATEALQELHKSKAKYSTTCPDCGETYRAQRRLQDFSRRMCGKKSCVMKRTRTNTTTFLVWYENNGAQQTRAHN